MSNEILLNQSTLSHISGIYFQIIALKLDITMHSRRWESIFQKKYLNTFLTLN